MRAYDQSIKGSEGSYMASVQQHHHHVSGWTGWIGFASVFMFLSGVVHVLFGIGAAFTHDWYLYSSGSAYVFDASDWGWGMIVGGVLLMLTSMLLVTGNMVGRIVAALLLIGGIAANVALLPVAPVWSVIALIVNVTVLYAVVAHGGEMKYLDEKETEM